MAQTQTLPIKQWLEWHADGALYRNCENRKVYNKAYHTLQRMKLITPKKHGTGAPAINEKGIPHAEKLRRQRAYMSVWRKAHPGWNRACSRRYQQKKTRRLRAEREERNLLESVGICKIIQK